MWLVIGLDSWSESASERASGFQLVSASDTTWSADESAGRLLADCLASLWKQGEQRVDARCQRCALVQDGSFSYIAMQSGEAVDVNQIALWNAQR